MRSLKTLIFVVLLATIVVYAAIKIAEPTFNTGAFFPSSS